MSVTDEIRAIYVRHGRLTPALVVDEARDETHPLHTHFQWDDSIAGEQYRQVQAARLIRTKVRVVHGLEQKAVQVRAFVHVPAAAQAGAADDPDDDPQATYMPQEIVAATPVLAAFALREMERRFKELRRTYAQHREWWDLVRRELEQAQPGQSDVA